MYDLHQGVTDPHILSIIGVNPTTGLNPTTGSGSTHSFNIDDYFEEWKFDKNLCWWGNFERLILLWNSLSSSLSTY